jgi:penicillin-binding protein 2
MAAKTGTGEVFGKQTTSVFASFAPADAPRYAVVMTVAQGGTGSGTSGPSVRRIYERIFGVHGSRVQPATALLPDGPPSALPVVHRDGRITPPERARARRR